MLQLKRNFGGAFVNVIICLSLIGLSLTIIVNRQFVVDQMTVWQWQPNTEMDTLIDRSGMNDYAKFLFHASRPVLDATQTFNTACDRIEYTTSILGCYSNYRIYIYNVTDKQLDGIREVTAAHEVLHAAYQRLSDKEKDDVNVLLEAEYKKIETNKDYSDRMEFYAKTEPGERDNELHSVIGTEIANVDPKLEDYYKKYFTDRQKVVVLNAKYSSVFTDLRNHANSLIAQMDSLTKSINERTIQYNSDVVTLNKDILTFNAKATSGEFTSQAQFNSERAALNNRVSTLDATSSSIHADVVAYNAILKEYNSIASESKKLYNSIDSTLAPAPSV